MTSSTDNNNTDNNSLHLSFVCIKVPIQIDVHCPLFTPFISLGESSQPAVLNSPSSAAWLKAPKVDLPNIIKGTKWSIPPLASTSDRSEGGGVEDSKMLENKTKKRESVAQGAIFGSAEKKKFSYVNMILEEC